VSPLPEQPPYGVHRIMGIETEYGISLPGTPHANPMLLSSQVVTAYANALHPQRRRARWDYEEEFPLRDLRGFDMARAEADASQLTDEDIGMANVILANGARLYVDHAHPEYSSPEVTNPRDAVLWDRAGERVMERAAEYARGLGAGAINLYKNNTDNKGASYGTHENYLVARSTPFAEIVRHLTPFFISRQVVAGAGRVGIGQEGNRPGFQVTQRADYFEVEVGLETTLKRPIINTRDEPHADPEKHRRLHVIIGDANLSEFATWLKMGSTALVLSMIEAKFLHEDLSVFAPVRELHSVSHDPTLRHEVLLRDGRRMTALDLQRIYLDEAEKFIAQQFGSDADAQTSEILLAWGEILDDLARDPMSTRDRLDWVAKIDLLQGYITRDGLEWTDPKLQLIDLQWSDVRSEKGLAQRLYAKGRLRRIVTDDQIEAAITQPPEDTRAWFRGRCVDRFPADVVAASWDSVIFDTAEQSLQRIPTLDPLRGTRAHVGALVESAASAEALLASLRNQR
jgi:proteasome accessory factor A